MGGRIRGYHLRESMLVFWVFVVDDFTYPERTPYLLNIRGVSHMGIWIQLVSQRLSEQASYIIS